MLEIEDLTTRKLTGELQLLDSGSGELFAAAPYAKDGKGVEPVSDSGRYFAIRVVNGSQSAVLGLGFKDRSEAFEFNLALQDFRKHACAGDDDDESELQTTDKFSLKEGQKIHINIKGASTTEMANKTETSDESAQIALLPPPPSSSRRHNTTEPAEPASFDDDFGDFQ